jgi:GNAT superfamily N-acetyltransferase
MWLTIEDLTLDNWPKFKQKILESELIFQESIRADSDDFVEMLSSENYVAKAALFDSEYIGNFFGICSSKEYLEWFELEGVTENPSSIYMCNFVINPEHQNKDYGQKLLRR